MFLYGVRMMALFYYCATLMFNILFVVSWRLQWRSVRHYEALCTTARLGLNEMYKPLWSIPLCYLSKKQYLCSWICWITSSSYCPPTFSLNRTELTQRFKDLINNLQFNIVETINFEFTLQTFRGWKTLFMWAWHCWTAWRISFAYALEYLFIHLIIF